MLYKTVRLKQLAAAIAVPLLVGLAAAILTSGSMGKYSEIIRPPLSPPGWVFTVVWIVLYIMMGAASYLVMASHNVNSSHALRWYYIQLLVNFIWPIVFFNLELYVAAVFILFVLWVMVLFTTIQFMGVDRTAGLLMVPYLVWLSFAAYLNVAVAVLN